MRLVSARMSSDGDEKHELHAVRESRNGLVAPLSHHHHGRRVFPCRDGCMQTYLVNGKDLACCECDETPDRKASMSDMSCVSLVQAEVLHTNVIDTSMQIRDRTADLVPIVVTYAPDNVRLTFLEF